MSERERDRDYEPSSERESEREKVRVDEARGLQREGQARGDPVWDC